MIANNYYVTDDLVEYNHLTYNGVFPKTTENLNNIWYTYEKTPRLFACLFALYDNKHNSDTFNDLKSLFDKPGAEVYAYDNLSDALNGANTLAAKYKAAIPEKISERTGACADA